MQAKNALRYRRAFGKTIGYNYIEAISISCLTETGANPTTAVADLACAWFWSQHKKQNGQTLGGILLRMKNMSMFFYYPFG
jgi:hypothetical protein